MSELLTMQDLANGHLDVKALGEAANGDENTIVTTRTGNTYPSAERAINIMFKNGGLPAKPFATKAQMETDGTSLADGQLAQVYNEAANNGLYVKTAGAWVKSAYDPLALSKDYTDTVKNAVNAKIEIDDNDTDNIVNMKDANGESVIRTDIEGKHYFYGIEGDLKTALDNADKSNLITTDETSSIFEHRDIDGNVTFKQDANGDLHAVNIGNITQSILSGAGSRSDNLDAQYLAGKYADYAISENMTTYKDIDLLITAAEFSALNLVSHEVGVLRIPAITRLSQYEFLVFFDAMPRQDDFGIISTCSLKISIDPVSKALTKSDIKVIHESFDDAGKQRSFIQNVGVKTDSGKVISMYTRRYQKTEHELYMRTSTDDGATWSTHQDISYVKNNVGINGLFPCSQGLVKRYGQHKGRIVFPVWKTGTAYVSSDYRAGYIYSDDDGVTWNLGEFAPYATGNEVQIAEDLNGDMLFAIRLETKLPPKLLVRHSDSTKEFKLVQPNKSLTDENVMGGLIQGDNKYDFSANKFMITTARTEMRRELLIHTSYDGGVNWRSHLLPETVGKSVAYTCIDNITASHKLLVWESNGIKDLSYAVLSIDQLIKENA